MRPIHWLLPASILLLLLAGLTLHQQKIWKSDKALFSHGLKCDPHHYPSLLNFAILEAQDQRPQQALAILKIAVEQYPHQPGTYVIMSQIYEILGDSTQKGFWLEQLKKKAPKP